MAGSKFFFLRRAVFFPRRSFSFTAAMRQEKAFRGEMKPCNFDFVVVGGGILGLAAAREVLVRHPYIKLALLEKEYDIATHQSTRHPGLIHSGVFFKHGTQMSKFCFRGAELLKRWCEQVNIPVTRIGKLVVATNMLEDKYLDRIISEAEAKKMPDIQVLIGRCDIRKVEPHCEALRALHIPHAEVVCWQSVAKSLADDVRCRGGRIYTRFEVEGISPNLAGSECEKRRYPLCMYGRDRCLNASFAVVCAGLFADRFAAMTGGSRTPVVFPMRAHYLQLREHASHLVKGCIYPAPDCRHSYFGKHIIRCADGGSVWVGPNVIPASKREGYKIYQMSPRDICNMATYRGFWRSRPSPIAVGVKGVLRDIFLNMQLKEMQRYLPELRAYHVKQGSTIVYPQVVDSRGNTCLDFVLEVSDQKGPSPEVFRRVLHCRVAPPAAATACLALAEAIADRVRTAFFENARFR